MAQVKELLDPSQRKYLKSSTGKRLSFERSLHLSAATLIIVPKALLEHWYEQIKRHLALEYFTTDIDSRGVVYLDGLGDIVDFQSPISRLTFHDYLESHTILAQYLIVVTTFERCASMRNCEHPVLSKIRWLRLIVDEGNIAKLHSGNRIY